MCSRGHKCAARVPLQEDWTMELWELLEDE